MIVALALAACSSNGSALPSASSALIPPTDSSNGASPSEPASNVSTLPATTDSVSNPTTENSPPSDSITRASPAAPGRIVVETDAAGVPLDRRLLGTNGPAWIGPSRLADPKFIKRVKDLGTTVLRMPGGSWSDSYHWLACENGDGTDCLWTWAARPSDYLGFLEATGIDGMWTVDANGTAQEAAALVAFFNGKVGDTMVIGVDRNGKDWGTVSTWATLRSAHGHPDPHPIEYWEVGNEVFAAGAKTAPGCATFGWENYWTCDGTAYVNGSAAHDGERAFQTAMKKVDPSIAVGAVGIGQSQSEWADFGTKVIEATGANLDFYVVHDYGFNQTPSASDALRRPAEAWPKVMAGPRASLKARNPNRTVPIAITEYNMFAFADGDTSAMMSQAIAPLYIADSIGQMAGQGVAMANQWNLLNGPNSTGSDYGMLDPDTSAPKPQYFALALWSRMGNDLVPVGVSADLQKSLKVYAARSANGVVTMIVINESGNTVTTSIGLSGATATYTGVANVASATALDATKMTYNGSDLSDGTMADYPGSTFATVVGSDVARDVPPFSITLLTLIPH